MNDHAPTDQDRLVWRVCPYLRDLKDCNECQPWEDLGVHGPCQRGCYALASDVVGIIQKAL